MSEMRCPKCGILIEDTDNFCRHCGRGLKPGQGFLHSHTGIILMMLILGPFALPLVWTSKQMGMVAKIIYTVIMVIMGYYLVLACKQVYEISFQMLQGMPGTF